MSARDILITVGLIGAATVAALGSEPRIVSIGEQQRQPNDRAASSDPVGPNVYYAGCNEVRAAGKAPLYAGQPGYRIGMDGDRDGIACEPHRRDR